MLWDRRMMSAIGKPSQLEEESGILDCRAQPSVFIADQSVAVIDRLAASISDVVQVIGRATNAHDAIIGIRNGNPQLLVLDIGIANGIDLLKKVKSHQPPVIVAILTHSAEEDTRRVCLRLGAEYFLDKLNEFDKVREIALAIGARCAAERLIPDGNASSG